MVRESIEKRISKKKEESILEKLKGIKAKEEKIAKEDKTGTAWSLIDPELLIEDARELFSHYEKGEFDIAQGELKKVLTEIEKIKEEKIKNSNESFVHWIDNKIGDALANKERREEIEKDNY